MLSRHSILVDLSVKFFLHGIETFLMSHFHGNKLHSQEMFFFFLFFFLMIPGVLQKL